MESGTHISIPLVYDLLLNQEIILLGEIKKYSKNELIKIIYQINFDDFLETINFLTLVDFNPNKNISIPPMQSTITTINRLIKNELRSVNKDKYYDDAKLGKNSQNSLRNSLMIDIRVNSLNDNKRCFEDFVKNFYKDNNNIPEIRGTARIYVRSKFDKDILKYKLQEYFSFPFNLRKRFFIINQIPNAKESFSLSSKKQGAENTNSQTDHIDTTSNISPNFRHTTFKVLDSNETHCKDLYNIKIKPVILKKNEITTKDIVIKDDKTFKECLSYFINKIFLVKQKENIYTIAGTEKDIYYFEKIIK